ncbi:MAG: hypothetical protein OHK93_000884 [Ramalina farinacea]|uniref:Uncharacterized protein n=1 Tax=Ramalina farinacea TaxID=258253 RepID=A0AA43QR97_9LECA|nr:hypothetical protein [Ramalina farinacea]
MTTLTGVNTARLASGPSSNPIRKFFAARERRWKAFVIECLSKSLCEGHTRLHVQDWLTGPSSQVIDVFSVAPQESSRSSSQDHVKAMLNKNGVDPARLSEREWLALSLQSPAEQRKLIRAYAKTMPKQTQEDEMPPQISKGSRDGADATKPERVPSEEEMIYRTIRRNGKEPISIILDERESAAAQAAMG